MYEQEQKQYDAKKAADERKDMSAREIASLAISGSIVAVAVIYWIVQISGVLEMMRLADGG